jgi:hypothetical protein
MIGDGRLGLKSWTAELSEMFLESRFSSFFYSTVIKRLPSPGPGNLSRAQQGHSTLHGPAESFFDGKLQIPASRPEF